MAQPPPHASPPRLLLSQTNLEVLPMGFSSGSTNCKGSPVTEEGRNLYSLLHTTFQECSILPFHFRFPVVLLWVFVLSRIRGGCLLFLYLSGPSVKLQHWPAPARSKACHFSLSSHQLAVLSLYKAAKIKGNATTSLVSL